MKNGTVPAPRPLIYGEVLFDRFPDGQAILGGAPFNVAWHLKGFGLNPLFISRVGDDKAGADIRARMHGWGMDLRGLQVDSIYPTGAVDIQLQDGQPSFDILADQAYDHIEPDPLLELLAGESLGPLYTGSLISRSPVSHATLDRLVRTHHLPIFLDVNLRSPWWELARVEGAISRARWVKLNDDELITLSGKSLEPAQWLPAAELMCTRFDLELLILTQGADGADIVYPGGSLHGEPTPVTDLVDTVGAGDAFSAVTLLGVMAGWDRALLLERALTFAARICQQRGATADDADLYTHFRAAWGL